MCNDVHAQVLSCACDAERACVRNVVHVCVRNAERACVRNALLACVQRLLAQELVRARLFDRLRCVLVTAKVMRLLKVMHLIMLVTAKVMRLLKVMHPLRPR